MTAYVRGPVGVLNSGNVNATFSLPVGWVAGDLHLLCTESSDSTTAAGTPATPSGWNKLFEETQGDGALGVTTLTIFARIARAGDTDPNVSGVSDHVIGRIIAIAGHGLAAATDVQVGAGNGAASGNGTLTGLTVPADSLVLLIVASSRDSTSTTQFSAWANANLYDVVEWADETSNTGEGGGLGIATGKKANTGATGNSTVTIATSEQWRAVHLAIKPPAPLATLTDLRRYDPGGRQFFRRGLELGQAAGAGSVALGGSFSSSGALSRATDKPLAGALSSSGVLSRGPAKILAGTLPMSGTVTRAVSKLLGGTLTSAGALVKTIAKSLGATFGSNPNSNANEGFEVDTSGWSALGTAVTLTRDTAEFHSGVASMRVDVVGGTQYSTGAILTYAAAAPGESWRCTFWAKGTSGETFRSYITEADSAGVYQGVAWGSTPGNTFNGSWQQFTHTVPSLSDPDTARINISIRIGEADGGQTFWIDDVILTKMTLRGTLAKAIAKPLAGTVSFSGALATLFTGAGDWVVSLGGTLTPAGTLVRSTAKSLAGTLSSAGTLAVSGAGVFAVALSGTLSSSGTLVKAVGKPLAGVFSSSGRLTKDYGKTVTRGTLTMSGVVRRSMAKSLGGTLAPIGTIVKAISHRLAGVLTFAGVVVSYFPTAWAVSLAGVLRFKGRVGFPPRPEEDNSFLDDRGVPWPERRRLGLRRRK